MKNHTHKKTKSNLKTVKSVTISGCFFWILLPESGLGDFLHQGLKFGRSSDRQVSENLAVETDIGFLQAIHKGAVVDIQRTAGGVDTNDPQLTILLFFLLAADIAVRQRFIDGIISGTDITAGVTGRFRRSRFTNIPSRMSRSISIRC